MKRILITNDDGFDSPGLEALRDALSTLGEVTTIAPACEKSACGHGLTLTKPLKFIEVGERFYKIDNGTPSDCVYLGLNVIYGEKKPDLIISGINLGSNMGEDITYSGTVAGAMEGCIYGIPSIAISQVLNKMDKSSVDFSLAKRTIIDIASKVLNGGFPLKNRKLLNINIPQSSQFRGYKITQKGVRIYANSAQKSKNPREQEYYWLGLHPLRWEERDDSDLYSDFKAIKEGYVSITPITLDMTSYDDIDHLGSWVNG